MRIEPQALTSAALCEREAETSKASHGKLVVRGLVAVTRIR
jgi:hypothetical protein